MLVLKYSLVSRLSGIYPFIPMHSLLVSKENGNLEITTQKWKWNFFHPFQDLLNHGLLKLKLSVLPLSYAVLNLQSRD